MWTEWTWSSSDPSRRQLWHQIFSQTWFYLLFNESFKPLWNPCNSHSTLWSLNQNEWAHTIADQLMHQCGQIGLPFHKFNSTNFMVWFHESLIMDCRDFGDQAEQTNFDIYARSRHSIRYQYSTMLRRANQKAIFRFVRAIPINLP